MTAMHMELRKANGHAQYHQHNDVGLLRRPPHNLEAEQALLGAVLVNNEAMDRVSGFLEPHHFFAACADLRDGGKAHSRRQERHADHAQDLL